MTIHIYVHMHVNSRILIILTHIHTCIHIRIHTSIHTYIHAYIHMCRMMIMMLSHRYTIRIMPYYRISSHLKESIEWGSPTHLLTYSLTHLLTYSVIHLFTYSLTHLFIHSTSFSLFELFCIHAWLSNIACMYVCMYVFSDIWMLSLCCLSEGLTPCDKWTAEKLSVQRIRSMYIHTYIYTNIHTLILM